MRLIRCCLSEWSQRRRRAAFAIEQRQCKCAFCATPITNVKRGLNEPEFPTHRLTYADLQKYCWYHDIVATTHPRCDARLRSKRALLVYRPALARLDSRTTESGAFRASGDCLCECGHTYAEHPLSEHLSHDGERYLNRLCNGWLVKL